MIKRIYLSLLLLLIWFIWFSNASILSTELIQSAILQLNYSDNLIQWKYDSSSDEYYICPESDMTCSYMNDLFQIKDSYICPGSAMTCSYMNDLFQIEDNYICPGSAMSCSYSNMLIWSSLIPIETIITILDDNSSSTNDFIQMKKDWDKYYMCPGDSISCSSMSDFIQIKKDWDKYYMCPGDSISCSSTSALTKTKNIPLDITTNMSDEELDKFIDSLLNDSPKDNTNISSQNQSVTIPSFTMSDVIVWMYNMWLTSKSTLSDFLPNDYLTREQASKFFVEFAKRVKWTQNNDTSKKVSFTDIGNADKTLKSYIIEANQMWIINWYKGIFLPFNKLTKAQALAMLIRITDWKMDETYNPRYNQYYLKAKNYWIITDSFWTNLDNENIMRWDIALLFYGMKFRIK